MDDNIEKIVLEAQKDSQKLNKLIEDFLPFIKRCISQSRLTKQSRDDVLTLAMLTFADCAKKYHPERGLFLAFAEKAIKNRLIDDYRLEHKHSHRNIPLTKENTETNDWETKLSVDNYRLQTERASLRLEIEELTKLLNSWNTSFAELTNICPKQKRTRDKCEYIAMLILNNEVWQKQLVEKRRMPNKEICRDYGVSIKILEKYRKYIAVLCIIQSGDYPMLRTFLPMNRKGGDIYGK